MNALSIVVITHRKGEQLARCLSTIRAQLHDEDDVVIIDDGGYDKAIVDRFDEPRFRYFPIPHRGYRLATLQNIGTILAKHERIVKIDGDCVPQPGWLDTYRCELEPGVLCAGRIDWQTEDGGTRKDFRFRPDGSISAEAKTFRGEYFLPHRVWGGNLGYWRPDLMELGGFSTEFDGGWGGEESDIGWRYYYAGKRIKFLFDAACVHLFHPPNPLKMDSERRQRNLQLVKEHRDLYARGFFPRPLRFPEIYVLVTHLGLRPPEETLYCCLAALLKYTTLRMRYRIVLQEPKENTVSDIHCLFAGYLVDLAITVIRQNRGLAWPKRWLQEQLPPDAWLATVDDDMLITRDTIERAWAVLAACPEYGAAILWSPGLEIARLEIQGDRLIKRFIQPCWTKERWVQADYAGLGCSLIRPEALRVCAFDDRYFVGGVDLDFCLQLKQAGYSVIVLADEIIHRRVCPPEYRVVRYGNLDRTWKIFREKWGLTVQGGNDGGSVSGL